MAAGGSIRAAGGYGGRSFRRNRGCDRSRDSTGGNAASRARLLPPPIAPGYCSLRLNMYSAQLVVGAGGGDRHALDRNQSLRVRTRRLVRGLFLRTPGAVRASTGHGVSPARMPRESNQEGERRKNELGLRFASAFAKATADTSARQARLRFPSARQARLRFGSACQAATCCTSARKEGERVRECPDRPAMSGPGRASPTAPSARPGESATRPTRWARSTTQDAGIRGEPGARSWGVSHWVGGRLRLLWMWRSDGLRFRSRADC